MLVKLTAVLGARVRAVGDSGEMNVVPEMSEPREKAEGLAELCVKLSFLCAFKLSTSI